MATAYDVGSAEHGSAAEDIADKALKSAAVLWFPVAVTGQWLFVAYIVGFFGPPTLQGNFEAWDRNKLLSHGYVAGDTPGNLALTAVTAVGIFGAHMIFWRPLLT